MKVQAYLPGWRKISSPADYRTVQRAVDLTHPEPATEITLRADFYSDGTRFSEYVGKVVSTRVNGKWYTEPDAWHGYWQSRNNATID